MSVLPLEHNMTLWRKLGYEGRFNGGGNPMDPVPALVANGASSRMLEEAGLAAQYRRQPDAPTVGARQEAWREVGYHGTFDEEGYPTSVVSPETFSRATRYRVAEQLTPPGGFVTTPGGYISRRHWRRLQEQRAVVGPQLAKEKRKLTPHGERVLFFCRRQQKLIKLIHAELHDKSFEIQYRRLDGGEPERRKISPLAFLYNDHQRHYSLLAWCHLREDYRNFLISGIEGIDPIDRIRPVSPTELLDFMADNKKYVHRMLLANRLLRGLGICDYPIHKARVRGVITQ